MKSISENYKSFKLPKLTSLKFIECHYEIQYYLKILFSCENICSLLKNLDLSNSGLIDNGMLRLKKNFDKIKDVQTINLENTSLTLKSKKFLEFFEKKKIKVLIDLNRLTITNKKGYSVLLSGSTISGKTSYSNRCCRNDFDSYGCSTASTNFNSLSPSFNNEIRVILYDMPRWYGKFDALVPIFLRQADGVLLLFDISSREDFDTLGYCLSLITNYLELEDFPVLLIANKIDLKRSISKEEIEKFQKDNGLIGYFEVSCRDGYNVNDSFDFLIDYLIKKEKKDYNIQ